MPLYQHEAVVGMQWEQQRGQSLRDLSGGGARGQLQATGSLADGQAAWQRLAAASLAVEPGAPKIPVSRNEFTTFGARLPLARRILQFLADKELLEPTGGTTASRSRSRQGSDAKSVSNDENHDVVKLDDHAHEPHIHESVRAGKREGSKRTRWEYASPDSSRLRLARSALIRSSPWERYKSRAHSFPDYGIEWERMGPAFLRTINATAGPVNTLSPQRSSSDVYVVKDSPPTKRQRQDSSRMHGPVKSPFFLSSKPPEHEDVLDLTRSVSRDDQYDLKSSSSTGKTTSSPAVKVSEFRNAHPQVSNHLGRKKRKSRLPSETSNPASITTPRVSSLATESLGPNSRSGAVNSPDILANDEHPPPAHVVSDVQQQQPMKRMLYLHQTESTGPPFKRPKGAQAPKESIDVSEDELSAHPDQADKKRTNFTGLDEPRQQTKARGDIHPTTFSGLRRLSQSSLPICPGMTLKKAACGKELFENDGSGHRQIILCPEHDNSFRLVPLTASGERLQLSWLNIDTKAAFRVLHAAQASPCVVISRSKTFDFEGKLALEFETPQDASRLISFMDDDRTEEKHKAEVEAIVHKAVQDAARYSAANGRTSGDAVLQLVEDSRHEAPWSATRTSAGVGGGGSKSNSIKNELLRSAQTGGGHHVDLSGDTEMTVRRHGPDTRRTRRSFVSPSRREPSPDCWTTTHPDWRKHWQRSLVFPATGKNRATVDDEDIPRLDEGEFLNDNLISFYLRYLQFKLETERPELLKKVCIFSSFFFEKLRSTKGKINYDGVKTWTAKFDLFSYDYIIVPVNEHAHWYLAIICNVPYALNGVPATAGEEEVDVSSEHRDIEMLSSPPSASTRARQPASPTNLSQTLAAGSGAQKFNPRHPRIITLDSLDSPHSATCKALREYLVEEAKDKKGANLALIPNGMTAKKIPHQDNFCDCGVFVLGYTEEFLKDPVEVARKLLHKESPEWDIQPSNLRNKVRSLLFELQEEQQDRLGREKEEKEERRRKAAKRKAAGKEKRQNSQPAEAPSPSPKASPKGDSAAANVNTSSVGESSVSREQSQGNDQMNSPTEKGDSSERDLQVSEDKELEMVSSLETESSTKMSTPNQIFHSARSSPEGKFPKATDQAVGMLRRDKKPNAASMSGAVHADELAFVQMLPSSSSNDPSEDETSKTQGQQIEKGSEGATLSASGRARARKTRRSSHFPSSTRHLISVGESTSQKRTRAGYDGIDRTVDLT